MPIQSSDNLLRGKFDAAEDDVELEELTAYLLEVTTTNSGKKTFATGDDGRLSGVKYYHCTGGRVWVVTRTPTAIFEYFGDAILSIEKLGPAYHLEL